MKLYSKIHGEENLPNRLGFTNIVIMDEIAKKKHGGARDGAGRKKTTAKRYGFKAPEEVSLILENVDDKTAFICEAILKLAKEKGINIS